MENTTLNDDEIDAMLSKMFKSYQQKEKEYAKETLRTVKLTRQQQEQFVQHFKAKKYLNDDIEYLSTPITQMSYDQY